MYRHGLVRTKANITQGCQIRDLSLVELQSNGASYFPAQDKPDEQLKSLSQKMGRLIQYDPNVHNLFHRSNRNLKGNTEL